MNKASKYLVFQKAENEADMTELLIYGDIRKKDFYDEWYGDDETRTGAFDFKAELDSLETNKLRVRINSYGGEVAEGLAIYNLLNNWKGKVETIVDGFACSAASIIFMAGESRIVPESGLVMIHNAWTYAMGDSNAMRKAADDIEKITQPSVNIYVSKTGLSELQIKDMMDKETWITSDEALQMGFATSVSVDNTALQSFESQNFHNLVMKMKAMEKEFKNKKIEPENPWNGFFR
jgi:ATP-dependent Clp protease protease subunit